MGGIGGTLFPLVFLLVHVVVTIAPVPRTLFTVSAGVLSVRLPASR
ncbi:hypothetical protein GS943_21175 [Rhodococcus hoagii]|nr:hypothetical protein [Prescottella equi]